MKIVAEISQTILPFSAMLNFQVILTTLIYGLFSELQKLLCHLSMKNW